MLNWRRAILISVTAITVPLSSLLLYRDPIQHKKSDFHISPPNFVVNGYNLGKGMMPNLFGFYVEMRGKKYGGAIVFGDRDKNYFTDIVVMAYVWNRDINTITYSCPRDNLKKDDYSIGC